MYSCADRTVTGYGFFELTVTCPNLWCLRPHPWDQVEDGLQTQHIFFESSRCWNKTSDFKISNVIRLQTIISYAAKSKDMSRQFYQFIAHHEVLLLRNAIVAICVSFSWQCRFGIFQVLKKMHEIPKCIKMPSSVDEVPKHALGKIHFELFSFDGGYCLDGLSIR